MDTSRLLITLGAVNGLLAVAIGAFGAHALKAKLSVQALSTFQTGSHYHFYHALGLLACGVLARHLDAAHLVRWSGLSMLLGIVMFSGSLYLLAITGTRWLGAVTPIGGLAFIAGWALLVVAALR